MKQYNSIYIRGRKQRDRQYSEKARTADERQIEKALERVERKKHARNMRTLDFICIPFSYKLTNIESNTFRFILNVFAVNCAI